MTLLRNAIRGADRLRALYKRRQSETNLQELRQKIARARDVTDMQRESAGWKHVELELQSQMDLAVRLLSDRTKTDDEAKFARQTLIAVDLLRAILSRIAADGQNALEELNLLTKDDDQHG